MQINNNNNKEVKEQRIRFILSHFEGRQQLFPRKISTALSQGRQFIVYSEQQILNECEKASFVDCRLNAYPVYDHSNEDIGSIKSKGSTLPKIFLSQAPNIIFIDFDLSKDFDERQKEAIIKLNKMLKKTLSIIEKKLNSYCKPTVLWTGNGYHIYIVLNIRPLELIIELTELSDKPSEEFLKFANWYLPITKKTLAITLHSNRLYSEYPIL